MNRLLISDSYHNADMFYATGVLVSDPFIYISTPSKEVIFANKLEYSRVKKEAKKGITIERFEDYVQKARPFFKDLGLAAIALAYLKTKRIRSVVVPSDFPLKFADGLRKQKISVTVQDPFYQERHIKTSQEIKKIEAVQRANGIAVNHAIGLLKRASIRHDGTLMLDGQKVTSEYIKKELTLVFMEYNLECPEMIVAGGAQSAMPHHRGTGVLKAGEPIIMDIFPRSSITRYWTDMTRTVCKGKPNNSIIRDMYNYVFEAQEAAYAEVKAGATGGQVHQAAVDVFKKYNMEKYFIHSTGHGVGIDIHEYPGIGPGGPKLEKNMIITNEPGLYIPKIGGIRIEDTLVVTKTGYKNLCTNVGKEFII